ncbi:type I secretion C-terminal target domain-containing protein, partial [uncultured Neptuniibacter sp.]|uniref:type I secretion C-terminal target domain-containing protein n=1 Tax=uncultured Neptuniibacter sp. TaxID=502143 RepID=UPI0026191D23
TITGTTGGNFESISTTGAVNNTVIDGNEAPQAQTDSASTLEGTVLDQTTSVLSNDSDAETAQADLTVSKVASDASGTNQQSVSGATAFATALGGSVVMNADGTYSYTAPVLDHEVSDSIDDYFYYAPNDGSVDGSWTKVTISVTDSAPTAVDDAEFVAPGGSVSGNLLSNDTNNNPSLSDADPSKVLTVTHDGVTKSFANPDDLDESGNIVFDTEFGQLQVGSNGEYTYVSDESSLSGTVDLSRTSFTTIEGDSGNTNPYLAYDGLLIYGFDAGDSFTDADGKLVGLDGRSAPTVSSTVGIGVGAGNNNPIDNDAGDSEALVIEFPDTVSSISLNLINANDGDLFTWFAFDSDGNLVDSGDRNEGSFAGNGNSLSFVPDVDGPFSSFVLSADPADETAQYRLGDFSYSLDPSVTAESFEYTMEDGDGDPSSATLTVTPSNGLELVATAADVDDNSVDVVANLVVNGSFEEDEINTSWTQNQSLTGWTTENGKELWNAEGSRWGDLEATDGEQLIEMDVAGQVDSIAQVLNTVAGESYQISLDSIVRDASKSKTAGSSQFEIQWDGVTVALVTNDPAATADAGIEIFNINENDWSSIQFEVLAADDSTELKLIETGVTSDTHGALVDNVKVIGLVNMENTIEGTPGNDILSGSDDDDIFFMGTGSDEVTTGEGNDGIVFLTSDLDDSVDTIKDFELGRDVLQLGDLLQGTSEIDQYLKVEEVGSDTVILIDTDGKGQFNNASQVDHQITLEGVSGLGGSSDEMLQTLIDNNSLNTDQ